MRKRYLTMIGLLAASLTPASAAIVTWTDWTSFTLGNPGSAAGTMGGVGVTYSGNVTAPTQVAGGINYWNPGAPFISATVSNAPPAADIIAAIGPTTYLNTITFSQAVLNPVMAVNSLGQPGGNYVRYDFNTPFDILSEGFGFWTACAAPPCLVEEAGDILRGEEGTGVIRFQGLITSISWTITPGENWHGFTVGVVGEEVVPEPGTWALMLAGVGLISLRRFRR